MSANTMLDPTIGLLAIAVIAPGALGVQSSDVEKTDGRKAPTKLNVGATDIYAQRRGDYPGEVDLDLLDLSLFPGYQQTDDGDGIDVPLTIWTHPDFPTGISTGHNYGISFVDYNMDGWLDIFVCDSARLWRGVDTPDGRSFVFARDLDDILPPAAARYCSSFADFDNDGDPDIATGPRNWGDDDRVHLLRNEGADQFTNVFEDPGVVDVQPWGNSEGIAWADVDCDGYLDMFCPIYPAWQGGPGNFFLHNQGPGKDGQFSFVEKVDLVGLDNPPGTYRPEGVQYTDYDFDGDLDLYSNGVLYRNVSNTGSPNFEPMADDASGIDFEHILDEGAGFIDYDNDGDFDLGVMYYGSSFTRLWENRGDGSFFEASSTIIGGGTSGGAFGFCVADWDMDGDMDMSDARVWRRNMLMETGERGFTIASHTIPPSHAVHPLPAWGDFDKDGDLDCALGNWGEQSHLYENTTYDQNTPPDERRHLRVRPKRNSDTVAGGLNTEYGAVVEVHLPAMMGPDGDLNRRRRQFVTTGQPYLNQGEYPVHFAMPQDPAPSDPDEDVHFDLSVDFPSLPEHGTWRVDKHVNPILGDMNLADIEGHREITVLRDGTVVLNDIIYSPGPESPLLHTPGHSLVLPDDNAAIPAPIQVPNDTWVGLAFNTLHATQPTRIVEVILDGVIASGAECGGTLSNVRLWDVTDPEAPVLVEGGTLHMAPMIRNHRSYYRADMLLQPGRTYRLVAPVSSMRETQNLNQFIYDNLVVTGAVTYTDTDACSGEAMVDAPLLTDRFYMTMRFRDVGTITGDLNGDGLVGTADLLQLLAAWGPCPAPPGPCPEDLDNDGLVGVTDLLMMLSLWS